jgi:hypothetical protein
MTKMLAVIVCSLDCLIKCCDEGLDNDLDSECSATPFESFATRVLGTPQHVALQGHCPVPSSTDRRLSQALFDVAVSLLLPYQHQENIVVQPQIQISAPAGSLSFHVFGPVLFVCPVFAIPWV